MIAAGDRPYADRVAGLLTRHGKGPVLASLFAGGLSCDLRTTDAFDTDALGTFTRDVPRSGSQLEAARRKAELACNLLGLSLGVGSEGSVGPDPFGLVPWDTELVCFVDRAAGIEVIGRASGPVRHAHGNAGSIGEAIDVARIAGFPEHGLVVGISQHGEATYWKGITSASALREAVEAGLRRAPVVTVETDMRAHMHPTRMTLIARAGQDLVDRLARHCPNCRSPGFGRVRSVPGARCRACGAGTEEPGADEHACVACSFRTLVARPTPWVDAKWCPHCNP